MTETHNLRILYNRRKKPSTSVLFHHRLLFAWTLSELLQADPSSCSLKRHGRLRKQMWPHLACESTESLPLVAELHLRSRRDNIQSGFD